MHCRTCGNEVLGKAVVCLACGCPPLAGGKFCQQCGAEAGSSTACNECGPSYRSGSGSTQPGTRSGTDATTPDTLAVLPPVVVGLAIFLFFPAGLYLLWRHPVLGRNRAWWWVGGAWSFLVLTSAVNGNKKPGAVEVIQASPARIQAAGEIAQPSRSGAIAEGSGARDEPTTRRTQSRASTARHNGGIFSSSWDYKNGCRVIYDRSVTKTEAKRLGDYLESQGVFDGDTKTFKIVKSGKTYEFRAVIKKGLEQDPEAIEGMKLMALELSQAVFGNAPVDVHLCDEGFETVRVVVP